ncbi:MAG: tetratricopeptide repeat protein [Limisphaerales bacterium]
MNIFNETRRLWYQSILKVLCLTSISIHVFATDTTSYDRGVAHIAKQEWKKAVGDFSEAIRLNPTNALAYEYRGGAYFANGSWDKAISDFTRVIQLVSTNDRAYFNRGSTYRSAGQFDKAMADINESLRLNRTNDAAYKIRASIYSFKGEFAKAIENWSEGLRLKPNDANALTCRGSDYFQSGHFDKAVRDHREAIRIDPKCDLAYNNLGWVRATCPSEDFRDGKEAVEAATKACELTNWQRWDWIDTLAAAHAEAGDFPKAIKFEKLAMSFKTINAADRKQTERKLSLYESGQPNHEGQKE